MAQSRRHLRCLSLPFALLAILFFLIGGSGPGQALTVTVVTSDNGYAAHKVQWTDAAGLPRSAVMVDQNASAKPYTGYLRRYTYVVGGVTRTCTGTTSYGAGGLETSGDGFVQNHTAAGGDYSTGNGGGTAGSTTITLQGTSHAIITYSIPTYKIAGNTVPTTVQWFFADGRSNPIYALSQDARGTAGNLGGDSRSPYGDMAYDGDGIEALVGGYSYGDTYKFVTLANAPEQVTQASGWKAVEANTIPYAMQWAEPATVDAEMGHVATVPITVIDAGIDTQTSNFDKPPDLFDPRTVNMPNGPLPAYNTQAYQIINDSLPAHGPTTAKRLTWGTNYGRIGGFDDYGQAGLNVTQYGLHSDDPYNQPLAGTRVDGLLMAYSVFVVFGPHGGGYPAPAYETGTVGTVVTQMENAALASFTATTGTVATSGPKGVGNASDTPFTYSTVGYNPIYGTFEVAASSNAVNATLTPAAGYPLDHPLFVVNGYTSTQLPTISVGTGLTTQGTDFYATVDTTEHKLWITVNRSVTSALNLVVTTPGSAQAQTITFPAITDPAYGSAPFPTKASSSSGLPITYTHTGPVTISNNTITLTGVGAVKIRASQPGNASYKAATSVLQSFTITQGAQKITFPKIANQTYGTPPFTLNATSSSGLPITYTAFGKATVSGSTVTLTGTGSVRITADQPGNTLYKAAPEVAIKFSVTAP